ncbi:MAG: hypothetical protein AAFV53_08075 [Myxococcota bacterium]
MSEASKIISAYVARVDELQKQSDDRLSVYQLKAIARELGVSEADLARAERTAHDHLQRGLGYVEHHLYDDAIEEFRVAVVLRPLDPAVIFALAQAYAARWDANGDDDDREEADELARQSLQLDPGLKEAFALRQRVQPRADRTQTSTASSSSKRTAPPLAAVGLLVLGITGVSGVGAMAYWMMTPQQSIRAPIPVAAQDEPVAQQAAAPVPAAPREGEIAVRSTPFDTIPGLTLDIQRSEFSNFNDSWSYKANGLLPNGSDQLVKAAKGQVTLKMADGTVIATEAFDIHEDYAAPLQPGDEGAYDLLIYTEGITPGDLAPAIAEFTILSAETAAAAARYPDPTPIAFSWEEGAQPPGLTLEVAQRSRVYSDHLSDQTHFRGSYVVTLPPGSASAEMVKFRVDFLDAKGAVIGTDESYLVTGQEPPIAPGKSRVVQFLAFTDTRPVRERLVVIEAR